MPDPKPHTTLDLSGLREAPPAEVAPCLEQVAAEPEDKALSATTALLMNRTLRLLRQGSREDLHAEALMLTRVLALPAGARLREARPEAFGVWTALGDLLSGAARSTSRAAVPTILRSARGRGQEILELLAGEGTPVSRSKIKNQLDLTETHLSHLLRDLEEADLILRYRPEGGKEVVVELGPVGHEHVSKAVLPRWLERLESAVQEICSGSHLDSGALTRELAEAGAPSKLAAERISVALARLSPVENRKRTSTPSEGRKVLPFVKKVEETRENGAQRFKQVSDLQDGWSPRILFAPKEKSAFEARS